MEIKAGREYRTRDGRRVGPLTWDGVSWRWDGLGSSWYTDGVWEASGRPHPYDLVAEWSDPPQPDADGWIEWKGGACPVPPETIVQVRFRDDCLGQNKAGHFNLHSWRHTGMHRGNDIIAYRIVTPAPKAADSEAKGPVEQPKTLRDEFAMAALTGLLAAGATYGGRTDNRAALVGDAYATADAMMDRRNAGGQP